MRRTILCIAVALFTLAAAAQKNTYPNTLLWRISGGQLKGSSYLFGTMHLQDRRIFQFSDSLYHYLEQSEAFATELNVEEMVEFLLASMTQRDTTALLKDVLSEQDYKKVARDLEKNFGVSATNITQREAWLYKRGLKSKLKVKETDMPAVVDFYLYNIARRLGKRVGGIEDMADQQYIIDELYGSFDPQQLLINHTDPKAIERMIRIYMAQDLNQLAALIDGPDTLMRDKILIQRNKKMAHRIDSMGQLRSHFFAIGAAHLPGTDGLIELLQQRGFSVEPVISKKMITPEQYKYTAVKLPWYTYEAQNKAYSVSMPGKGLVHSPDGFTRMNLHMDLGSGIHYFALDMPLSDYDKRIAELSRKAKSKSEVRKVNFKGANALETEMDSAGYYYRVRVVPNGNAAVLLMVGSHKKNLLYSADAEKFYESLQLNTGGANKSFSDWHVYEDRRKAMTVKFPVKPEINKALEESFSATNAEGNWRLTNRSYFDQGNNILYMVIFKETAPGLYIASDEEMFLETKTKLEEKGDVSITRFDTGHYQGHPALWLEGKYVNNQDMRLRSLHVNRGNRSFSLMSIYYLSSDTTAVQHFFDSFRLLDFVPQNWKQRSDPTNTFITSVPAPIEILSNGKDEPGAGKYYVAYDTASGFSFQVVARPLSPYYWATNDSAFFADNLASYMGEGDSLLGSKPVTNGKAHGIEYRISSAGARNIHRIRIFPYRDSSYALLLVAPLPYASEPSYEAFFEQFRFTDYRESKSLFAPKTAKLLADLGSKNAETAEAALEYLGRPAFTSQDLPLLHQALEQLYDDPENDFYYNGIYDKLAEIIIQLNDVNTIKFIREHYSKLTGARELLRPEWIKVLAGFQSQESYETIKKLLQEDKTSWKHTTGLGNALSDSAGLLRILYPALLARISDSAFVPVAVHTSNVLFDSGHLDVSMVAPHRSHFRRYAQRLIADVDSIKSARDYLQLIYFLGHLKDSEAIGQLQQLAGGTTQGIQYQAVRELVEKGRDVPPVALTKLASDAWFRIDLYELLESKGQLSLFPAKYRNQKSLAESQLMNYVMDDAEPEKIEFVREAVVPFQGVRQKFNLFRVYFAGEEGSFSHLGVTGPYPLTGNAIKARATVCSLASPFFDPKAVDAQLKILLQEWEAYLEQESREE